MEYLGTIYKGSQSDIIFPVPFIELSDGATVDFYTDGDGGFSKAKDEIKIDNYMLRTTASADELNSLNDGVLNYTINTCMGKSEGDTGLYLSEPTSYVDKQYLTADNVKTINGESIVGEGNIEIQGGGSEDYIWEWGMYPYETATTDFTADELQSVLDAYESGKRIVIKYKDNYIYPYTMDFDTVIFTLNYNNDNDFYKFTYVKNDNSQNISKIDTSTFFIFEFNRISPGTTSFTKEEIADLEKALIAKKIILISYGRFLAPALETFYALNNTIQVYFFYSNKYRYLWQYFYRNGSQSLSMEQFAYEYEISTINNNIKELQSSSKITNDNIQELSGNTITLSNNLTTLSGSVQDNYYTKTEVDDKIKNISGGTSDDSNFKKLRIDISGNTLEQDFMPLFNYLDGIPNSPDMLGCINLILDGKLYIPTRIETEVSSKGYIILIYATGTIDAKRVELFKDSADSEYINVYIENYKLYSDAKNGLSIFIPTTSGNAGQILKSNGEKQIPTWVDFSEYSYTKEEIDSKIGDINNILESI